MEIMDFSMHNCRTCGSRVYSGRSLREEIRKRFDLNNKDMDRVHYRFIFPKDTMSINSSYFSGLWGKSVIILGREDFLRKYEFIYADGAELKQSLKDNIEEGIEDALKEF